MRESKLIKGESAPLIFGHRGCPLKAPENNLSSFEKALELNVPGVELDVQICSSGELVVYHDNNMKRTTGFDGDIVDSSIEQIRELDNGSFFSAKYKGEKIPLFEEVLELLKDKVYYDIELKADYTQNRGLEHNVLKMIKRFNLEHRVVVSSFNPIAIRRFIKLKSGIPTFLIYSDTDDVPSYLRKGEGRYMAKVNGLKPDVRLLSDDLYKKRSKKYSLMSWTVDNNNDYKRLINLGIEGICSNRAEDIVSGEFID